MQQYYIYITTNLINNKKYIGQHFGEIDDAYMGSGVLLTQAIKKYGKENFTKATLCICENRAEADRKEKEYIKKYDAVNSSEYYNIHEGGTGGDGWRCAYNYLQKHPEICEQNGKRLQQWRKDNPELFQEKVIKPFLEGSKKWREHNPDRVKDHMKKLNQAKVEWQKSHPQEHQEQINQWRKKGSETNSKKILCITTNEIFPSLSEAARYFNTAQSNISKCLKGERKSAGKHPETKEKLFWKLIE